MRDAAIDTHRSSARGAGRSRAAGAPPLDDMVGEGPVSRAASRPGGVTSAAVAARRLGGGRSAVAHGRPGPSVAARLRARLPRIRPLKALTIGAFGVALVGIVANAMVFQRGHHPSPLFGLGRPADGTPDAAQRTAAAVPAPALPAPVEKTGTIPPTALAPVDPAPPPVAAAAKPAPAHHAVAKAPREAAAKPRPADAPPTAHPRPGRLPSVHATAEPRPVAAKPKPAAAKLEKAEADPVAKLLAGGAHAAVPENGTVAAAKPASKPETKPVAAAAPAHVGRIAIAPDAHPHHHLAATEPAKGAKPAAETE